MSDFVHLDMSVNKHTYLHYGQWLDLITKQLHYIYDLRFWTMKVNFQLQFKRSPITLVLTRNTLEQTYETADINDS